MKTPFKLDLKRQDGGKNPDPGAAHDCRILDASGEDLARVEGKRVLYPHETARGIVRAVNGQPRLLSEIERLEKELAQFKATPQDLKLVDLRALSRHSDILFTHIRFEDYELQERFTVVKDGVKHGTNWLEFGECQITNEGRNCFLGARIRDGITDFEHDSCYVARIELVGLQYKFTANHVTYLEANVTPRHEDILIYEPDFVPEKIKGSWKCKEKGCDKHLMLPDGYFCPPIYKNARVVAGRRVSISMGPRWDVIEGREEADE